MSLTRTWVHADIQQLFAHLWNALMQRVSPPRRRNCWHARFEACRHFPTAQYCCTICCCSHMPGWGQQIHSARPVRWNLPSVLMAEQGMTSCFHQLLCCPASHQAALPFMRWPTPLVLLYTGVLECAAVPWSIQPLWITHRASAAATAINVSQVTAQQPSAHCNQQPEQSQPLAPFDRLKRSASFLFSLCCLTQRSPDWPGHQHRSPQPQQLHINCPGQHLH